MRQSLHKLIALICALFLASAAFACATCKIGLEAPRYISGGIGEAELAALRDREKDFNVKMVFADAEGAYVADVAIVIRDARGNVTFADKNLGPILLIQLPDGAYEVSASRGEKSATGTLKVDPNPRDKLVFVLK
jgi:hypothetical protein